MLAPFSVSQPIEGAIRMSADLSIQQLFSIRLGLASDVRLRVIGDELELAQRNTGRVIPLTDIQVAIVRELFSEASLAGIVCAAATACEEHPAALQELSALLVRLHGAQLLTQQSDTLEPVVARIEVLHLARLIIDLFQTENDPSSVSETVDEDHLHLSASDLSVEPRPINAIVSERMRILRSMPLLSSIDDKELTRLAELAQEETWPAASDIVTEGARADRCFIVRSGEVVITKRENGALRRIASLGTGDWFGAEGLAERAPRNATVRASAVRPVQLFSFDAEIFSRYIAPHVDELSNASQLMRRRAALNSMPLFASMCPEEIDAIAGDLEEVYAPRGTILFKQGESADRFYLVVDGAVGVVRDGVPIARLSKGEFFGETALLFTEERTATIAATEDAVLWSLDRKAFVARMRELMLQRNDLRPLVVARIESTQPI